MSKRKPRFCTAGHELPLYARADDCQECRLAEHETVREAEEAEYDAFLRTLKRPAPDVMVVRQSDGGPPQAYYATPRTRGRRR